MAKNIDYKVGDVILFNPPNWEGYFKGVYVVVEVCIVDNSKMCKVDRAFNTPATSTVFGWSSLVHKYTKLISSNNLAKILYT